MDVKAERNIDVLQPASSTLLDDVKTKKTNAKHWFRVLINILVSLRQAINRGSRDFSHSQYQTRYSSSTTIVYYTAVTDFDIKVTKLLQTLP